MKRLVLVLALLLVSGVALAQSGIAFVKFDFTTTTDSGWLRWPGNCNTVSIHLDPDIAGTATGATVHIRESPVNTGACSDGDIIAEDRDGDGLITTADEVVLDGTTGDRGFRGVRPSTDFYCIDVVAAPTGGETARVSVTCQP